MPTEKNIANLNERVLNNLGKLPEADIQEVLDFIEFIQIKRQKLRRPPQIEQLDPKKDPVLKLMGIADVTPFADKIDQELYGQ